MKRGRSRAAGRVDAEQHDNRDESGAACVSERGSSPEADRMRAYRVRRREGLVRLTVWADRLWLADMLYQVGELDGADSDDTHSLEAAHQRLVDWLLEEAKEERAHRVTRNGPG